MSKSKRAKEERERFKQMPEGDLLELRGILHREVSILVQQKDQKVGTIKRISAELTARQHAEADRVVVTDHAVVRYLERVHGMNIEAVRQTIAAMGRRTVRRNDEFMDDPETGMIVVRKSGTDSIATVMNADAILGD